MSNRVKIRELNGGRLTRPRSQWASKPRGSRSGIFADAMQQDVRQTRRLALLTPALFRRAGKGGDR